MKLAKPVQDILEELEAMEFGHKQSLDYLLNTEHDPNYSKEIDYKKGKIEAFEYAIKLIKEIL